MKSIDGGASKVKVYLEYFPHRVQRDKPDAMEISGGSTGFDLLADLGLHPDAHILAIDEDYIPLDQILEDGKTIKVIGVISGGVVTRGQLLRKYWWQKTSP